MSRSRARQFRFPGGARLLAMRAMLGVLAALGLWCGDPGTMGSDGPQATLALVSPMGALGLSYGEQATLTLRYRRLGQGTAGTTLSLHIDTDNTGTTLSADRVITNDRGEASVLLTAGAAEVAFHVLVSAPQATDLVIDVAVSRYRFGILDVSLDASAIPGVTRVRAALVPISVTSTGPDLHCAKLMPTPKLDDVPQVLRRDQADAVQKDLTFANLLLQPYSVLGRAEDSSSHLLGYGCVDLSDDVLRTGLQAKVPVPLSPVYPSPLGSYKLDFSLQSKPASPGLWDQLACPAGLGQVLIDWTLQAVPTADKDVATRLQSLRGALDPSGCRTGSDKPDDKLHALLAATPSGTVLVPVAQDAASMVDGLQLETQLQVYASTSRDILASHTLVSATLAAGTRSTTYSLATLPVPTATNLLLTQSGYTLKIPEHALTLRLPSLWRKGMSDLVLAPRSLTMTPAQLFQAAVAAAVSGGKTGCDAVESLLCGQLAPPCSGKLSPACLQASGSIATALTGSLEDPPPSYDLWLSLSATLQDPEGTLKAKSLDAGQVSGRALTASGTVELSGTAASSPM